MMVVEFLFWILRLITCITVLPQFTFVCVLGKQLSNILNSESEIFLNMKLNKQINIHCYRSIEINKVYCRQTNRIQKEKYG